MAIKKLHQFDQGLFHNHGICHWMCTYMLEHSGGPFVNSSCKSYDTMLIAAQGFTAYIAAVNWAKAKQSQEGPGVDLDLYNFTGKPLPAKRMFRVVLYIGAPVTKEEAVPNHEILCFTGSGTNMVLFDPNFGFYEINASDLPEANNRDALKHELRNAGPNGLLYGKLPNYDVKHLKFQDIGRIDG